MKHLIIVVYSFWALFLISQIVNLKENPKKPFKVYAFQNVERSRILPIGFVWGRYRTNEDWTRR